MPRKKKAPERDLNREAEILKAPINPDGHGEDPVVRAIMSEEFVEAPDPQALDMALALQQLLRGQSALMSRYDEQAGVIHRLRARMEQYDEASRKWQEDQKKFIEGVLADNEKLRMTEPQREKLKASTSVQMANEMAAARAQNAMDKAQFEAQIKDMPKVQMAVPGKIVNFSTPNGPSPRLMGEEIRIRHLVWNLPPGEIVEVPVIVRDRWLQIQRERAETDERKNVLRADGMGTKAEKQDTAIVERMAEIDRKYGAPSEQMPIASR